MCKCRMVPVTEVSPFYFGSTVRTSEYLLFSEGIVNCGERR